MFENFIEIEKFYGSVVERPIALVSKARGPHGLAGSNPAVSANIKYD